MKGNTRGTTMVEVIVAFTILILIMGMFSQALAMSGRMAGRSTEELQEARDLAGDYYLEKFPADSSQHTKLEFRCDKNGEQFEIPADIRKYSNTSGSIYDVVKP